MLDRRQITLLLLIVAVLAGCDMLGIETGPWREKRQYTFVQDIPGTYPDVYPALAEEFRQYGWGDKAVVHADTALDTGRTSLWASVNDSDKVRGFLLEIGTFGLDQTRVVVYPQDRAWADKARQWLTDVQTKHFSATPAALASAPTTPAPAPAPAEPAR
jgi:hypothetical protein